MRLDDSARKRRGIYWMNRITPLSWTPHRSGKHWGLNRRAFSTKTRETLRRAGPIVNRQTGKTCSITTSAVVLPGKKCEGMVVIDSESPPAHAMAEAIHFGDLLTLRRLLRENPGLATARVGSGSRTAKRTLPHVATEPPAHDPHRAGTALHWAASTNDVGAIDALLNAGADIEAPGGAFGGGTALGDAVGFGQWQAARRLIERGAQTTLWQAAALGLRSRIRDCFPDGAHPAPEEVDAGFWYACRCGQFNAAILILYEGADLNRIPEWEKQTPFDAACLSGAKHLVQWLRTQGARSATDLR
jgi:uncharacterized protein